MDYHRNEVGIHTREKTEKYLINQKPVMWREVQGRILERQTIFRAHYISPRGMFTNTKGVKVVSI